jgi:hypothetical protein
MEPLERASSKRSILSMTEGCKRQTHAQATKKMPRMVAVQSSSALLASAVARRDGRENVPAECHPHHVLLQIMKKRGCCTDSHSYNELPGFFHRPLQKEFDAYSGDLLRAVRDNNVDQLRKFLNDGRILNCCNQFGEHLLHLAARKQLLETVDFLLNEAEVQVRVHDDFGRTPLHDACWTDPPCFGVVDMIIDKCPDLLLVVDKRGHTPLFYARREHWDLWISHLSAKGQAILPQIIDCDVNEVDEESSSEGSISD